MNSAFYSEEKDITIAMHVQFREGLGFVKGKQGLEANFGENIDNNVFIIQRSSTVCKFVCCFRAELPRMPSTLAAALAVYPCNQSINKIIN